MKQRVAILPGIVSGNRTTRRLRKLLRQAGYEIVADPIKADVVLAHSAGCLWLPKTTSRHRQTFVLVNPTYWPGRTVRERIRARSHSNARFYTYGVPLRRWLVRQVWGVYYAVRNPRRTRFTLQRIAVYNLEQTIHSHAARIVLVRNHHDDWLTPDPIALLRANPNIVLVHLPGEHDDFNYHPERYVQLLQSLT